MKLDVLTVAIAACIAVEPIKAEEEGNYTYVPNPFLDPDAVEIDANQPLMLGVDIYPSRPERKPKGCASELHSGGSVRALCALYLSAGIGLYRLAIPRRALGQLAASPSSRQPPVK